MSAENGERRVEIPPRLLRAIERERRRMGQATSLLKCLAVASMYEDEIDATDVAEVARRLIDKAIDRLDAVELRRAAEKRSRGAP